MATNIKLKSSSLAGKTPTLSDLSLRELAVNTADGKLFLRKGDGSGSDKIIDVTAPLQASEPMGHEDKSQSTISFNSSTRVFTIQPASTSFNVWVKGVKYNFTTAQTVTIPNTTGLYYIYFNSDGVLSSRTTYFDWENEAPTAYVYWNATTGTAPFVADERHGITLDWATHEYLHRTRGAVIANGFSLGNFTTTGTGSTDADSQFDLGNGTFFDEDLEVDIVHSNTPVADTWQQDLQGPARIPVFYLSGTGWIRDNPTDYALKQGTARIQYNLLDAGTWSTVDVPTNTHYTTSWIIATNNINYPVLAIMGQSESNKISDQESISFSDLVLTNFPVVEFRPLWKIIWETDSRYANTPKARIAGVYDIRQLSSVGIGGVAVSDHGLLTGLTDDDHLQYLHTTTTRTGVTAEFNTTGKITTTNKIGIGTASPETLFDIWGDGSNTAQVSIRQYNNVDNDGPDIRFFTAKGTPSSPLGIQSGDITGRFNSWVYNGSTFIQSGTFGWQSTGTDGRSSFLIANSDGTNVNTNLFIADTGIVAIGTTNPQATSKLEVQTPAFGGIRINALTEYPTIWLAQNGTDKWSITSNFNNDNGFVIRESGVADRINILPGGNVGIGTTNPTGKLDVQGGDIYLTTASDPRIFIQNSGVGGAGFDIRKSDGTWAWRFTGESEGFKVRDQLNSLDKFYIEDAATGNVWFNNIGNFGIGTTTPVSKVHAVVGSSSRFVIETTSAEVNSPLNMWNNNSSATAGSGMVFSATTDLNQSIDTVFIGGVSSQRIGTDFLNSRTAFRVLSNGVFTDTSSNGVFYLEGSSTGPKIIANGFVGIGVTNPTVPLDVFGASAQLRVRDANVDVRILPLTASSAGIIGTWSNHDLVLNTNNTEIVRFKTSGNVGIGLTDPSAKLHVSGQIFVTTGGKSGSNTYLSLRSTDANSMELAFSNLTNTAWQIQSTENGIAHRSLALNPSGGNVGIGTTNPTTTLDVRGTINVAANLSGQDVLHLNNNNIYGINNLRFGDPGPYEGIVWDGGNGWNIFESPNDLITNAAGNLQFTTGTTRRATLDTNGKLQVLGGLDSDAPIREKVGSTYHNVVTQFDIGFNANQIPLNQYLGQLAFLDQYSPSGLRRDGGGSDDLVVDSDGRILGFSSTAYATSSSVINPIQFNASNTGITLGRWENSTSESNYFFLKSRGTVGNHVAVQNADGVGFLGFEASDGTQFRRLASISVNVNGTPSPTSMPGTIVFNVTPANSVTAVERLRIGQSGLVTLGTSSGGTSAGFNAPESNTFAIVTNNTEQLRVSSTGNVGIGTTNPTSKLHVQGSIIVAGSYETSNNIFAQGSASITGGVAASINQLSATGYRSVEYTIQAVQGTNYHITKILAIHDGTNVSITEYGTIITNVSVASYSVDISGGNIVLTATPASASTTTFKLSIIGLKV